MDVHPFTEGPDGLCTCGLAMPAPVHSGPDRPHPFASPTTGPSARRSDPDTSHAAARSAKYRAGSHKALLAVAFRDHGPCTDSEAAEHAGLIHKIGACWWHRCSDLRADGVIERVGTALSPHTGEEAMVCQLTEAGAALVGAPASPPVHPPTTTNATTIHEGNQQ